MIFIPIALLAFMTLLIVLFVMAAAVYGLFIGMRDEIRRQRSKCKRCKGEGSYQDGENLVICDSCLGK